MPRLHALQAPGTIRAKFGTDKQKNAIHASAIVSDAEREIGIWFGRNRQFDDPVPALPTRGMSRVPACMGGAAGC
jgi:hypothetical protein